MLDETPRQQKFSGICIGGPLDGNIAIHSTSMLEAAQYPETCIKAVLERDFNEMVTVGKVTYRYTPLWVSGDLGFWIPVEELNKGIQSTNDFVLDHLAKAYANKHPSNGG